MPKGKVAKKSQAKQKKGKVTHSTDPSAKKKVVGGEKIKRTERADEKLNEDGIPLWLAGEGQESKNLDVIIEGFNMTVPGGGAHLLNNTELRLVQGRHYGLIGKNGIGKSTLLRHIASGTIEEFPNHLQVLHMEQELKITDETVINTLLDCDWEKQRLEKYEEKLLTLMEEEKAPKNAEQQLEMVYAKQQELNVWEAEARARKILKGLGFSNEQITKTVRELSGGWRMRVAIASALFATPDILCLDEPTNHLDFPSVIWLQRYLKVYPKTLVIVTHDRHFLNEVISDVIDFRDQKLTYYRGDYTTYLKTRSDNIKDQTRRYEAQQKQILQWKAFCERFKHSEKESTLVQSRLKALKNLELIPEPKEDKEWHFNFPEPETLKTRATLLEIQNVSFAYNEKKKSDDAVQESKGPDRKYLIEDVSAHCDFKSRVGMLGANGVGKSTLIKLVLGELQPNEGKIKLNEGARTACFTQHHQDLLKLDKTPMELLQEIFKDENVKDQEARNHLGAFGIKGDLALQKIELLSGGQKSRVSFAILTFLKPHLIIMDEPTNHLDLETIESLLNALNDFPGGVILVSHDQYFLSKAVTEFWGINAEGQLKVFHDIDEAKDWSYKMPDPDDDDAEQKKKKAPKKKNSPIESDVRKAKSIKVHQRSSNYPKKRK